MFNPATDNTWWNMSEPSKDGAKDCISYRKRKGWKRQKCSMELPFAWCFTVRDFLSSKFLLKFDEFYKNSIFLVILWLAKRHNINSVFSQCNYYFNPSIGYFFHVSAPPTINPYPHGMNPIPAPSPPDDYITEGEGTTTALNVEKTPKNDGGNDNIGT